jgi:hypothetical protein
MSERLKRKRYASGNYSQNRLVILNEDTAEIFSLKLNFNECFHGDRGAIF